MTEKHQRRGKGRGRKNEKNDTEEMKPREKRWVRRRSSEGREYGKEMM